MLKALTSFPFFNKFPGKFSFMTLAPCHPFLSRDNRPPPLRFACFPAKTIRQIDFPTDRGGFRKAETLWCGLPLRLSNFLHTLSTRREGSDLPMPFRIFSQPLHMGPAKVAGQQFSDSFVADFFFFAL